MMMCLRHVVYERRKEGGRKGGNRALKGEWCDGGYVAENK